MLFDRSCGVLMFVGVLCTHAAVADSWITLSKPDEPRKTFVDEQSLERYGNIAMLRYKTTYSTQQEKLGKRFNSLLGKVVVQCDRRKYRIASEEWYNGIQIAINQVNYPATNPFLDARPDTVAAILISLACGERTFASIREALAGKEPVRQPAASASANPPPPALPAGSAQPSAPAAAVGANPSPPALTASAKPSPPAATVSASPSPLALPAGSAQPSAPAAIVGTNPSPPALTASAKPSPPAATVSANPSLETAKQSGAPRLSISEIDPRFASIVVVSNARGFGTGFFIAQDTIITNEHVVAGADFTDVRFHDGRQSFGKVIKRDLDKDLALIRVADQGKPVIFADAVVRIGNSVDVIGHPRGLGYSLSRGVVSAIRAMNNPASAGGKPVKYIQTDAVINAGNSGGPMFIDNKVVGINTQKLSGGGIEGIGFAVHLDEIREFIRQ